MQTLALLTDPRQPIDVRVAAARALATESSPQAIEALAAAMDVSDEALRDAARDSLRKQGGGWLFLGQLGDAAPARRALAARALRHLREKAALPALAKALNDPEEVVRREAAHALAVYGAAEAEVPLCKALSDPLSDVRYLAAVALRPLKSINAKRAAQAQLQREDNAAVRLELGKLG